MFIPKIKKITLKRLRQLEKGRGNDKYQQWRRKVFERDEWKCQFPGCSCTENLQAHHIRRFVDARHLRYSVMNGLSLCAKCHQKICGSEGFYEKPFFMIAFANYQKQKKKDEHNS